MISGSKIYDISSNREFVEEFMKNHEGEYVLVKTNEYTWKTHNLIEGEIIAHSKDEIELEKLVDERGYPKDKVYTTYIPHSGECLVR